MEGWKDGRLRVLVALPRPIITLLAEEDGEIVPVARWERASGASAVPPLRETPKLDAVVGALQDRPVCLTLLRQATVEALQDALRDPPHVFVLDTHGDEDGLLLFEGPCGETNPLPAAELGDMLARRGVRLAVLSACYSEVAAQAVCQAGVPLAVGMTESIYEDTAAAYLAAFLGALAGGDTPKDAHQDGLTRLRTRLGRRPAEAELPCLLVAGTGQPLATGLSGPFENTTPPLPQPEPELPLVQLFGRELDQVLVQRLLLQGNGRLVTLTGAGGIGKTVLARAVAHWTWQRNLFPGGVYFASLETLAAEETVAGRLMGQLGLVPGEKETPEDALVKALGGSAPALLVADNCETAGLQSGLEVLTRLRGRCPRLYVLTTALHSLELAGAVPYPLPPLALNDAVDMFLDRAGRPARDKERPVVEAICEKLDRVPLHIEL